MSSKIRLIGSRAAGLKSRRTDTRRRPPCHHSSLFLSAARRRAGHERARHHPCLQGAERRDRRRLLALGNDPSARSWRAAAYPCPRGRGVLRAERRADRRARRQGAAASAPAASSSADAGAVMRSATRRRRTCARSSCARRAPGSRRCSASSTPPRRKRKGMPGVDTIRAITAARRCGHCGPGMTALGTRPLVPVRRTGDGPGAALFPAGRDLNQLGLAARR